MKRILLLEDHRAFRQALAWLLDREPDFEVVAQAGSLAEGRDFASNGLGKLDAAVLDLLLPDGNGMELSRELRTADPGLPVLVLTIVLDGEVHDQALAMGADEVLVKTATVEEILAAVRRLANGKPSP